MANGSDGMLEWLDTTSANHGLTIETRTKFANFLESDDAYQFFADFILVPPPCHDDELRVARSYRALQILKQDLMGASRGGIRMLLNPSRAGLLTKQVFSSLSTQDRGVLIHKRALLDALLEAYPSAVVSATCAGGKEGLNAHLQPMMLPQTCSQTLPTLTCLVLYGCTGRSSKTSAERQPTAGPTPMNQQSIISHGHRRKFVRSLADWNILQRLVQCIAQEDDSSTPIGLGEEGCEALLTIVECVGYPHPEEPTDSDNEPVGEEMLLAPLGDADWWKPLMDIVGDSRQTPTKRVAAARAMFGIFGLATGRSSRIRRSAAPAMDATDQAEENMKPQQQEEDDTAAHPNKLRDWGLTSKIHMSLVTHLPQIVKALMMDESEDRETQDHATVYIQSGDDSTFIPLSAVRHPGGCRIVPFTSWRLQMVNLLAELISYDGDDSRTTAIDAKNDNTPSQRCAAMNALMGLPIPPELRKDGNVTKGKADAVMNPWPTLCDWSFQYPENNLYHVQFLRMFQAICLEHHEASLRLVLQKCKFVSRAVRTCQERGPLRGVLLACLNILRLRSQSLPPRAFLRQFLESHDAWKNFHDDLYLVTMEQQPTPGSPPGSERSSANKPAGIDLGSRYASQLGFDGFKVYEDGPASKSSPPKGSKKKKRRKKKQKQASLDKGLQGHE